MIVVNEKYVLLCQIRRWELTAEQRKINKTQSITCSQLIINRMNATTFVHTWWGLFRQSEHHHVGNEIAIRFICHVKSGQILWYDSTRSVTIACSSFGSLSSWRLDWFLRLMATGASFVRVAASWGRQILTALFLFVNSGYNCTYIQ